MGVVVELVEVVDAGVEDDVVVSNVGSCISRN